MLSFAAGLSQSRYKDKGVFKIALHTRDAITTR